MRKRRQLILLSLSSIACFAAAHRAYARSPQADRSRASTTDTVADYDALRAYSGTSRRILVTSSGISGQFARVDDYGLPDNGGTVIRGNHIWVRQFRGRVDVRWFGATADNATDDSSKIATAFQYCAQAGLPIAVPAGNYRWSTDQVVTIQAGGTLDIDLSPDAVLHLYPSASSQTAETACIQFNGQPGSHLLISGGMLFGQATLALGTNTQQHNLRIDNVTNVQLNNLKSLRAGMSGVLVRYADSLRISGGQYNENSYSGVLYSGCSQVMIGGNAEASRNGDKAPDRGYGFAAATRYDVNKGNGNVVIDGAIANYNKRKGFDAHDAQLFHIDNVVVTGYGSAGIYAVSEGPSKRVARVYIGPNCRVEQDASWLRSLASSDGLKIGNELDAIQVGAYGPHVVDASEYIVDNPLVINPIVGPSNRAVLMYTPEPGSAQPQLMQLRIRIQDSGEITARELARIGSGNIAARKVRVLGANITGAWSNQALAVDGEAAEISNVTGVNVGKSPSAFGVFSTAGTTQFLKIAISGKQKTRDPIGVAAGRPYSATGMTNNGLPSPDRKAELP